MKGSRFHLDLLKTFVSVVETASFSAAAARNHLTQSAVSQQVAFLEQHFGRPLLLRGNKGPRTTKDGEAFLRGAKKLLKEYSDLKESLRAVQSAVTGLLRVEAISSIDPHSIAGSMRKFRKRYPGIELKVGFARYDSVYRDVLAGSAELGIVAFPRRYPELRMIPLRPEPLVVALPGGHPLSGEDAIDVRKLDGEPFVAFEKGLPTRTAVDRLLRAGGAKAGIRHAFDNIADIRRSVEIGEGISILPAAASVPQPGGEDLILKPLAGGPRLRPLGAVYLRRSVLSEAAELIIQELTART